MIGIKVQAVRGKTLHDVFSEKIDQATEKSVYSTV
jgi:hypothetical protein